MSYSIEALMVGEMTMCTTNRKIEVSFDGIDTYYGDRMLGAVAVAFYTNTYYLKYFCLLCLGQNHISWQ
jgi:hypothetical protein